MRYLLDTCVISELQKADGDPRVRAIVDAQANDHLFLSAITIGEIAYGVNRLGAGRKRAALESWLAGLPQLFASRLLPIDEEVAMIWGEITAKTAQRGRMIAAADGLIAATALRHGLHVMTRDVADFQSSGVLLLNPWT